MFVICYILCFCNIFFCVSAGKYIIEPSQQNAIEGFDFKLTCKVPGEISPPKRLAWTRNTLDVAYMSPSGEDTEIIDSKYTFHFKNERLYELTINGSDVMAENRSRWLCQDAAGGSHSQIYEMIVYAFGLPLISGYKNGDVLHEGDSKVLTCEVTGSSVATGSVVWRCGENNYPGKTEIHTTTTTKMSSSITLLIDRSFDNSVCTCEAYPDVQLNKHRSTSVKFLVQYSPNVTVTKEMVPRNNSLILTCVADGNPKNFSFHGWKHIRNKSMVRSNKDFDWMSEDKSELVLKNITYRDNGEYLCSVDNGYRDKNGILLVREGHINVFVEDSPDMKIVTRYRKEKNSMDLNCVPTTSQDFYTVSGWTQVTNGTTVRSTEDFKSLTDNNRKLTLRDYTYSDSGVYTCFYNYRHIFDGQVQTFLEFKGKTVFVVKNKNFYFRTGDNGSITIPFYTNPKISSIDAIMWENMDAGYRLLPSKRFKFSTKTAEIPIDIYGMQVSLRGQIAVLEIENLAICDAGKYSLTVQNEQDITSSVEIYIHMETATDAHIIQSAPEGPTNLRTNNITENSVDLSWDGKLEEAERQTLVLSYEDKSGPVQTVEIKGTSDSFTVSNLTSTRMYRFSLYAYTDHGNSSICGPIEIVTRQHSTNSTEMSKPTIALLSTLIVIVFVIILIPAAFYIYRKATDTKYVRLRKKRQGNGSVYYDRMHQRIGLFNPLAELIEADLRRCSMTEYSEIKDFMLSSIRSRQNHRTYLSRRSFLSSYHSDNNLYFPMSLLQDMQNYENTRLNS